MFSVHSRGDLIAYLEGQGFVVGQHEQLQDLRAAATLHAQVVALARSPVFAQVMTNAERVTRQRDATDGLTTHFRTATVSDDRDEGEYADHMYDELF